jgi:F-type H+-transporting ATPase subunit c
MLMDKLSYDGPIVLAILDGVGLAPDGPGNAVSKALESMARQPEMASTLRTNMILGCAITETTGIYSLVVALLLMFMRLK